MWPPPPSNSPGRSARIDVYSRILPQRISSVRAHPQPRLSEGVLLTAEVLQDFRRIREVGRPIGVGFEAVGVDLPVTQLVALVSGYVQTILTCDGICLDSLVNVYHTKVLFWN